MTEKRILILEIWGVLCIFCTRILLYELHWILILFGFAAKWQNSPKKQKKKKIKKTNKKQSFISFLVGKKKKTPLTSHQR